MPCVSPPSPRPGSTPGRLDRFVRLKDAINSPSVIASTHCVIEMAARTINASRAAGNPQWAAALSSRRHATTRGIGPVPVPAFRGALHVNQKWRLSQPAGGCRQSETGNDDIPRTRRGQDTGISGERQQERQAGPPASSASGRRRSRGGHGRSPSSTEPARFWKQTRLAGVTKMAIPRISPPNGERPGGHRPPSRATARHRRTGGARFAREPGRSTGGHHG